MLSSQFIAYLSVLPSEWWIKKNTRSLVFNPEMWNKYKPNIKLFPMKLKWILKKSLHSGDISVHVSGTFMFSSSSFHLLAADVARQIRRLVVWHNGNITERNESKHEGFAVPREPSPRHRYSYLKLRIPPKAPPIKFAAIRQAIFLLYSILIVKGALYAKNKLLKLHS